MPLGWMDRGLAGLLALAVGVLGWTLVSRPQRLSWSARRPGAAADAPGVPRVPAAMEPWRVLLPARWMRWGLRRLQWLAGAVLAAATLAITHNLLAAAAFGWIGFGLPEVLVREVAWSRWQALDRAAYATVYSARFYLEQGVSVLETWRALIPEAPPVLRQWVQPCLLDETVGRPFERTLKAQALAIRHLELAVAADVLTAERQHGGAVGSLAQLLAWWGKRIELAADRQGSLAGAVWIGRFTLGTGLLLFWGLTLGDAHVRAAMHTPMGGVVTGLSAALLALSATLYARQTRQAEQF